jgi:hypothetical protein
MTLMSWRKPMLDQDGIIKLENPEEVQNQDPLVIKYDKRKFVADVETIPLKDARLQSSWGERLYRIMLTAKQMPIEGDFTIKIER